MISTKEIKITAGRDVLSGFASKFAEINDDILFGEAWATLKICSIVTVTAIMSSGTLDSSLKFHFTEVKKIVFQTEEIAEVITHASFYVGWPKAWAI